MRTSRLAIIIISVLFVFIAVFRAPGPVAETDGPPAGTPAGAPAEWQSAVERQVAEQEYQVTWQARTALPGLETAWQAPNRAHNLRAYFTPAGLRVVPRTEETPSWEWGLEWVGYGRGGSSRAVPPATPAPEGARVDYRRGFADEWYENTPRGLKHGFVLSAPPEEPGAGPAAAPMAPGTVAPGRGRQVSPERLIHVDLALTGTLRPVFAEDGLAIDFETPAGARVLRYAELAVTDARGMRLAAWMEGFAGAGARGIRIVIDDVDAVYPVTIDPLATSPAWTKDGGQATANFGYSVATAGDVNGDGYSDVIVGAPNYDNGQSNEGRAFVYLGSASGLAASPAWTEERNQMNAYLGSSVATAGDVNGDGYSDLIVGAYGYDASIYGGAAFLYLGSAAGPAGYPNWSAVANQASADFGCSVASAGDVNNDGRSDVIIGARRFDNVESDEGRAYVFLGTATGLATSPVWTAEPNQASASFGGSVATAGDVNGDGYADVIVGAQVYDNGQTDEGRAYVYLGSAAGPAASPAWTAEADQASVAFGCSVATAGDINGDGYSDVIVGAYSYDNDQTNEGRAFVYHGSAAGLGSSPAWTAESHQTDASYGNSVAPAGDVNGDGYADVIVAAYLYDNGQTDEGRAFVYAGSATGLAISPLWTGESDQVSTVFGRSVATAGDVNGDGFSDVIVGGDRYDNTQVDEGRAWVFLGSAAGTATAPGWMAESDQMAAYFGVSVATAGDVNGDGYSDAIVGAYGYDNGQSDEGRAYLYLGSASGLSVSPAWTAEGDSNQAYFGMSVATAGDVNGDGYADVVVGAPRYSNGQYSEGRVFVFLGSASGLAAAPAWAVEGGVEAVSLGTVVAPAGDVNGDGFADLLALGDAYDSTYLYLGSASGPGSLPAWTAGTGARFDSIATAGDVNGDGFSDVICGLGLYGVGWHGRVWVYFGSPSGPSASPDWTVDGDQVDSGFGWSVATAGDVNGDGFSDVIVGAYDYDNGQQNEGRASLFLGSVSGPMAPAVWTAESDQADAHFGLTLATAGDVNGDGFSDIVVAAPDHDNGQLDEGRAYIFLGSASGLSVSPAWTAEGDQIYADFGRSMATAGDVNGDGYSDVIVGAKDYDNGQQNEGRAFVHYGNGGRGLDMAPRQLRAFDSAPVAALGLSDSPESFRIGLKGRTPFGRGRVRLQWEAKTIGSLLDGSGFQAGSVWISTGVSGTTLGEIAPGFGAGDRVRWRARVHHDPASFPFQPHGRWVSMPWNSRQEVDLRTRALANLGVTQSDSLDPVLTGEEMTYDIDVRNLGPDPVAALLEDILPAGSTFVSASGAGAVCQHAAGVVRCALDPLPPDGHAIIAVTIVAGPPASAVNEVRVYPDGRDPVSWNDTATEGTTVFAPGIGDRVWLDMNGDGILDPGEYGLSGVLVALYRSDNTFLASTVSGADGFYSLTGLTYGQYYYLRVFPSEPYGLSPADRGGDEMRDSDVDPVAGRTATFRLYRGVDVTQWDAGVTWDSDRDGHTVWEGDCDDLDPTVYPGATQACDGKNNDCDDPYWPVAADSELDRDADGIRPCDGDCNDADPAVQPGADETCNSRDDDCDVWVDEACDTACDLPAEIGADTDLSPAAVTAGGPRIAWAGDAWGVTWQDKRDGNNEIYFARFDAAFNRIGDEVRVTNDAGSSSSPSLAWTGSGFGIAWYDDRDGDSEIYFARLDAPGAKIGGDVRVTSAAGTSRLPRVAWSGIDYGLLWSDQRDGTWESWFARVDATGTVVAGSERRLTATPDDSNPAHFAWNGSVYGIVYNDFRDGDWEIYFQAIDRLGAAVTLETRLTISAGVSRVPVIAWDGAGQFGVAWADSRDGAEALFFTRVAADGTKITGDHSLTPVVSAGTAIQSIVHTGGEYALAWIDSAVGNPEVYFARLAQDALGGTPIRVTDDTTVSQNPALGWNGSEYAIAFADNRSGGYHAWAARIGCCTVSTIGDRAWTDTDHDGVQDAGEPGAPGILVALYDAAAGLVGATLTAGDGSYAFTNAMCGGTYSLQFIPPAGSYLSAPDQGGDDTLDSDADPVTGSAGPFVLSSSADAGLWDAGVHACWVPDEAVFLYMVTLSTDGHEYPILHFQDPNQPGQTTGYNVYRSSVAGLPRSEWPLLASDVVDMDAATPDNQWVDSSGDISPTGAWYYDVAAYNHHCPAEGPR